MRVDLSQTLPFPSEIVQSNLRLDLVLWSKSCQSVFIIELTRMKDSIDEAFKRTRLRYVSLAAEARGGRLERKGASSGSGLQGVCCQFHCNTPDRNDHQRDRPTKCSERADHCQ